jgi:hypothetical protein
VTDINGDGLPDILGATDNGLYWQTAIAPNLGAKCNLLATFTLGLGASTTIAYKPLTDSSIDPVTGVATYTKETTGVYPVQDVQMPLYVVSQVTSSNGVGGVRTANYTYAGAKTHLTGGGFLGFRQTQMSDADTLLKVVNTFRQDYPYHRLPVTTQKSSGTVLLDAISNIWEFDTNAAYGSQYHAPKLTQSVESAYELTGAQLSTVTTCNAYDAYGNATQIDVWTTASAAINCKAQPAKTGMYVKEIINTYPTSVDTVNWRLNQLIRSSITNTTP